MSDMVLVPDYFEKFHCLGADCKYNCCQGWTVSLTKQDYMKIRALKPSKALQEKINSSLKRFKKSGSDETYAEFTQELSLCQFQDENGLCSLQIECGYKALPSICQNFPRFMSNLMVMHEGLSTGCEYVVSLLMESDEPLRFKEIAPNKSDLPSAKQQASTFVTEYRPIMKYYSEIRRLCIAILQNRKYSLDNRMILLGMVLKGLNDLEQAEKFDDIPAFLSQKLQFATEDNLADSLNNLASNTQLCALNNLNWCIRGFILAGVEFSKICQMIFNNLNVKYEDIESGGYKIECAFDKYQAAVAEFKNQNYDIIFEKVLVNNIFTFTFPFKMPTIWEGYVALCHFYSSLKFMVTGCIHSENEPQTDLTHLITICSRFNFHGDEIGTANLFETNKSDTLAHMVIMIKG